MPGESLATINSDRVVPLVEGDYDFSWSYVDGQPIALVAAETSEIARCAASLVNVEYQKEPHATDI